MKKVAIVTGSSRGIGRAIALELSKDYRVIVNCKVDLDGAKETLKQIEDNGGEALFYQCDVGNSQQVKEMLDFVLRAYGRIDVLVNNAGEAQQKLFTDITDEEWLHILNNNLNSMFFTCKNVIPHMISEQRGKIINISSIWGVMGGSMETHYSASKAGVIGFSKALAKEVALSNITVNCVAPGVIDTKMIDFATPSDREMLKTMIPLGKIGTPEDIAKVVAFLASPAGDYITSEVINVNGGFCS